jgi:hypothetical protein
MDRPRIRPHSGGHGSCMEDRQAPAGHGRGRGPLMDYYTIVGFAIIAILAGLVGVRLAKDEISLRRKRVLIE